MIVAYCLAYSVSGYAGGEDYILYFILYLSHASLVMSGGRLSPASHNISFVQLAASDRSERV